MPAWITLCIKETIMSAMRTSSCTKWTQKRLKQRKRYGQMGLVSLWYRRITHCYFEEQQGGTQIPKEMISAAQGRSHKHLFTVCSSPWRIYWAIRQLWWVKIQSLPAVASKGRDRYGLISVWVQLAFFQSARYLSGLVCTYQCVKNTSACRKKLTSLISDMFSSYLFPFSPYTPSIKQSKTALQRLD